MANAILFNGSGVGAESALLTATKEDVLEGQEYIGADTDDEIGIGTMPNNGAINKTISFGDTYKIPYGYHNGSGIVRATNLSATTATASSIIGGKYAWGVNSSGIKSSIKGSCVSSRPMYTGSYITFSVRGRYYRSGGTDTNYRCRAYFTVPSGKTFAELFNGKVTGANTSANNRIWGGNYITTNIQTSGIGSYKAYMYGKLCVYGDNNESLTFYLCGSDVNPLTDDSYPISELSYITEYVSSNYKIYGYDTPYDGMVFGNSAGL